MAIATEHVCPVNDHSCLPELIDMLTDLLPQSFDAPTSDMPDAPEWMQILDLYIEDQLTAGPHDDGAFLAQSDCRVVQRALRIARSVIERARQAGEPDPVLA